MLMLLIKPLHIRHEAPKIQLQLDLKVRTSIKETIHLARQLFEAQMQPTIDIHRLGEESVRIVVSLSALKARSHEYLMNTITEAMDSGKLDLLHCQFI